MTYRGDQAFTRPSVYGTEHELEFAGATSLFRRGYTKSLDGMDAIAFGIPYDLSTTYRPGARLGPRAVRSASSSITHGRVWPWGINPFSTLAVSDWGDVMYDEGSGTSMCESVLSLVRSIPSGCVPIAIGGDHYVTLPILRGLFEKLGPLSLMHFDAHSDTWVDERHHHGSVFYHALREGLLAPEHSVHVGVRTFNETDHDIVSLTAPWIYQNGAQATATTIVKILGPRVYISFDVDVLDPAFAPGTGTPSPGGLSPYQVKQILYELVAVGKAVVGLDLVEVAPPYDVSEVTSLAGASLLLDLLCLMAAARMGRGRPDDLQGGSGRRLWLKHAEFAQGTR